MQNRTINALKGGQFRGDEAVISAIPVWVWTNRIPIRSGTAAVGSKISHYHTDNGLVVWLGYRQRDSVSDPASEMSVSLDPVSSGPLYTGIRHWGRDRDNLVWVCWLASFYAWGIPMIIYIQVGSFDFVPGRAIANSFCATIVYHKISAFCFSSGFSWLAWLWPFLFSPSRAKVGVCAALRFHSSRCSRLAN